MASIEDLTKDCEEIKKLLSITQNVNNFQILANELHRIYRNINSINSELILPSSPISLAELTTYGFDQSAKFIKLFVTLDGVSEMTPNDTVLVHFSKNSICLLAYNINGKNYKLLINNLFNKIEPSKCYYRIKTNLIAIYGKKMYTDINWPALTTVQTKLKEMKKTANELPETYPGDPNDPRIGHLNFMLAMKKIYETGDPKMKRKIEMACAQSEDRIKSGKLVNEN